MGDHDLAHLDHHRGLVVAVCVCGHRSEAPSRKQAEDKHQNHFQVERARAALKQGRGS